MLRGKVKRYMSEKITSVEDEILSYQEGQVASGINVAYTFIPCAIEEPIGVIVTPVKLGALSANGVALFTTVVGYEVDSLDVLSVVADLDAHAASIDYEIGTIVKATDPVDSVVKAYVCNTQHTSTAGPDFEADIANWDQVNCDTFLKLTHTAAGADLVANFTYLINGYKYN